MIKGTILKQQDLTVSGNQVFVNGLKTNGKPGMLLLHADYCSHCHVFMPTFNQIYDKLKDQFVCASIESKSLTDNAVVSALNFKGYPTILFFDKTGRIIAQHEGARDLKTILQVICKVYHQCAKN